MTHLYVMQKTVSKVLVYCHINSDDDQWQLVEILVLDILSIKLKYVSKNTLYHNIKNLLSYNDIIVVIILKYYFYSTY